MFSDLSFWLDLERPARYLGVEPGTKVNVQPDERGSLFRVALAFPDLYEIAHSHVGHKILYHMLNQTPGFSAERVYAPWLDLENKLRSRNQPLFSLESKDPLLKFDMVGFSLQYEMAYTNILNMLELAGLPFYAAERDSSYPLVVGGGPGASNPEPLADFFDFFFLGDAEASFMEDMALISDWRREKAPKSELFERLAGRPGIYAPSLFEPKYDRQTFLGVEPKKYPYAARAVASSLSGAPFPACQIAPFVKPVHDRAVVEIGRGCTRGCRFCQAGFLYRPVRERSSAEVLSLVGKNLKATGQDEAAFLSLSAGDHTQIEAMVEGFMDEHAEKSVALSLPSLRVKSLSDNLARQIKRVRKTGFTLAPEAGTERLRAVINKDLTEEDVFRSVELASQLGWKTIKLYFMAGLPTETEEDLLAIVDLCRKLKKRTRANLNIGLAHFTPKAHTPFQWAPGADPETIRARLAVVRQAARQPGLNVRYNDPAVSFAEGLLSRGDRRLGPLLLKVFQKGARFEAWNDRFNLHLWLEASQELGLDLDALLQPKNLDDALPWDHLFCGVTKKFLISELKKAERAETSPDCRLAGCLNCGACGTSGSGPGSGAAGHDLAEPERWTKRELAADESYPEKLEIAPAAEILPTNP
ncbi:MAG: TIGR03960 family B12-binding radical SAM protein, partial [Deltaproteobacteria bacterium]|nr:TIGR03960 family B12-binding radical SAM protein [Deltaproteobacteria bacterium]